MKVHIHTIYKLYGISALPERAPEIELVNFLTPQMTALLTVEPEPHFAEIDRVRAVANQLLKGIFASDEAGKFDERLAPR